MVSSIRSSGNPDLLAAPRQGMQRGFEQLGAAAQSIAQGEITPDNAVQMIQAEMLVKANVVAARTADEILGSLLDTLA